MRRVVDFLGDLSRNNDREWFEANRGRYVEALGVFNEFAQGLIEGLGGMDVSVAGLTLRDCTYRIYRDVRFSSDKSPYKNWMGCYVCPGGKKSGRAGYYFHIEPGACLITAGLYMPEPVVLRSVRDEIADNPEGFLGAVSGADGFVLGEGRKLARTPKGFPAGTAVDEYLRMRDICLERGMDVSRGDLLEWALAEFRKTQPFVALLNRAVDFAFEEM